MARVVFRDPYKYRLKSEYFIATEGMYTGQFVYCGAKGKKNGENIGEIIDNECIVIEFDILEKNKVNINNWND